MNVFIGFIERHVYIEPSPSRSSRTYYGKVELTLGPNDGPFSEKAIFMQD